LGWCLVGAPLGFSGFKGQAQEALLSSLSVARALNPVVTWPAKQSHVGPIEFAMGLYTGFQLNDNVNYVAENPQSDTILRWGMTAGFTLPATEQSGLNLNTGVGYAYYLVHPQYSAWEISPDSALSWDIAFEDGSMTLFDQFSFSQQVGTESALYGVAAFPRFDNTIGIKATWLPNRWRIEGGYSHNNFFSDSSAFDYLNRSSEFFFARVAWRFAEATEAGVEVSSSLTDYEVNLQNNNTSLSLGPYADWQVTQSLKVTLRGGWTSFVFSDASGSAVVPDISTYYAGLELTQQLTDFLSHRLTARRDVRLGINAGSDYIQEFVLNYSLNWKLTQSLTLETAATFEHGKQPLQSGVSFVQENYDWLGIGPTASWQATGRIALSAGYSFWQRTSNLPGHGYVQNSLTLRLDYQF
jgi:hypothetical protein